MRTLVAQRSELLVIALLTLCISVIYGARLSLQPLVGEETRWATAAREMLATGDWVVPRQQGHVFPERPPMTMWLMAIGGWLRGDVDPFAVRLPSVIAVALTSLLIYIYARSLLSKTSAIIAVIVYATFGQVLVIGRLGESESVFALFVSASLLLWHFGYVRNWRPLAVWSIGFAFAALAALVKGPQAPIYFGAITCAYLLFRRDWRYLLSWQTAAGAAVFIAIVAAWQVPFYRATDWAALVATWAGLAGDRIHLSGVLTHFVTYPVETFICLLPWSPALIAFARPGARKMLADKQPVVTFLLTAIVVAYPTVWIAAGARGRYFMPIYPLVAVLIGLVIERIAVAHFGTSQHRGWRQFLLSWAFAMSVVGLVVAGSGTMPGNAAGHFYQPRWFCFAFGGIAIAAAAALWKCYRGTTGFGRLASAHVAVIAIATVASLGAAGILVNVHTMRWYDPTEAIAEFKSHLPVGTNLVSFTPIDHRFAYYYSTPIAELDWPRTVDEVPANVDYFCFMRNEGDTAEARKTGRGRTWCKIPGTLPFAWEELKAASVDRQINNNPSAMIVVLGRVVRPLRAEVSDATKPQHQTAGRAPLNQNR